MKGNDPMQKKSYDKLLFTVWALFFLVITAGSSAYGYGGGGGGGGEGGAGSSNASTSTFTTVKPLTAEDIKNVFTTIGTGNIPGFDSPTITLITTLLEGHEMSIRDLMTIRQTMLTAQNFTTTLDQYQAGANLILIQILDGAGQISQIVLTIVPGVGWGTNAALGIARSGADEIKKGSDISKIGGEMLLDGAVSVITKGVPLGDIGDAAINKGVKGVVMASGAISKTVQKNLVRRGTRRVAAGLAVKALNREVGNQTKELVRWSAEQSNELYQWATAQQDQNQVTNQAPPMGSYNETLSAPASGTTDSPISFP